jgi:hypothetical protein
MVRTIITSLTENGIETITTDITMDKIKKFIEVCKGGKAEDNAKTPDIILYIKEKYPDFYESGMKENLLDEAFAGAVGILADDWGTSTEDAFDFIHLMTITDDSTMKLMAYLIALAKERWIDKHGNAN